MVQSRSFRHCGLILVRATTDPGDLDLPDELDLTDRSALETDGRAWLAKTWAHPRVRQAIGLASPVLAASLEHLVDGATPAASRDVPRALVSLASYLKRWRGRATPFGLFAGVTTARIGPAAARFATHHRAITRPDAEWLAGLIDQLEQSRLLRTRLRVIANTAATFRDGRVVVMRRAERGARTPGPAREASVRATGPVRLALATARTPVAVTDLAARIASRYPAASIHMVAGVLDALIDHGLLLTSLRPPMTAVDGLAHLTSALRAALTPDTAELRGVAAVLTRLENIHDGLARHNTRPPEPDGPALSAAVARDMAALAAPAAPAGPAGPVLAADIRLDATITIPERVLTEAGHAASVLLRTSTQPFGTTAWLDYHARFRARYGPGALVPVSELVSEAGLGYPSGFLGAPRARPTWRMLTERDAALMALIQRTLLDRTDEIALTDTTRPGSTTSSPATYTSSTT